MKAYKGFDKNMQCRGFQYEEGKVYETDEAKLCESGFHACERPLDVLTYYPPGDSVYHVVELDEVSNERRDDSKVCGEKIKIGAAIDIAGLVKATVDYTFEKSDKSKRKHTTEDYGAASATGNCGAASATGYCGAASATGYCGAASATGYCGAASAGHETAISVAWGREGKARGVLGSHIVCAEWREIDGTLKLVCAKMARVDGETIKGNVYYRLENGEFVEA